MLFGRKLRLCPRLAATALAGLIALSSSSGHAQSTSDDLARRHFESGVAYLEESDYDAAITAFQKAYDLSKRPEILLNLATVYERKSDLASAVAALKAYLEAAPEGEHTETAKLRVQNLEKRSQEQSRAAPPAEAVPAPPPPTPAKTPPPAATPARSAENEPSRLPAFVSLGVGGLLAGGALATGLVAQVKYDDAKKACGPSCGDDQLSSSRTFAMTSTVLTGAAAIGIGLGVVLLLTTPEAESDLARDDAPRLDLALGPGAIAANAGWWF